MLVQDLYLQTTRDGVSNRRTFLRDVSVGAAGISALSWMDTARVQAEELRNMVMVGGCGLGYAGCAYGVSYITVAFAWFVVDDLGRRATSTEMAVGVEVARLQRRMVLIDMYEEQFANRRTCE